ncbi:MAG TPA: PrsW family glutamic-type intramembrane protease [Solirubrobacter sp.]|nr:PrsW family glutamic-type intramembrane protease [Solirubrobacter sp.]
MTARTWPLVLVAGLALWVASAAVLALTEDEILLPTVVLVGSFVVPVAVIFWFFEHDGHTELSARRLVTAFFVAGVVGLLGAAVLEVWLLPSRLLPNIWVGLIEEATKAVGVIVFARGLHRHTIRDGVLLGVVVGLGFGAFESAGYTLTYGAGANGYSLPDMLNEEILRAVIAPFCHGLWTGIFGAAWFASGARPSWRALGAYAGAVGLHSLWDASSTAGIVVAVLASGDQTLRDTLAAGELPQPAALDDAYLYGAVQWGLMILVAALGAVLIRRRWLRE